MHEAPSDDVSFNTEALKLLLQVAWANDDLDPAERVFVERVGRAWKVPDATLGVLLGYLDQGKPLPQPNVALLRTRPDKVMRAAEALIHADGGGDVLEEQFLGELATLLGVARSQPPAAG